jgi:hypothetical protein
VHLTTVTTGGGRRPRTHDRWAGAAVAESRDGESRAAGGARGSRRPGSPEAVGRQAKRQRRPQGARASRGGSRWHLVPVTGESLPPARYAGPPAPAPHGKKPRKMSSSSPQREHRDHEPLRRDQHAQQGGRPRGLQASGRRSGARQANSDVAVGRRVPGLAFFFVDVTAPAHPVRLADFCDVHVRGRHDLAHDES